MPAQRAPAIPTVSANMLPLMEWIPPRIWVPMIGRFTNIESTMRFWSCSLPWRM